MRFVVRAAHSEGSALTGGLGAGSKSADSDAADFTPERRRRVALALTVLSDETCSKIMRVLAPVAPNGMSAQDIADVLGESKRTTLRLLSILRRAKLVRETRISRIRHYSVDRLLAQECGSLAREIADQLGAA